jgi:hypothetical protein
MCGLKFARTGGCQVLDFLAHRCVLVSLGRQFGSQGQELFCEFPVTADRRLAVAICEAIIFYAGGVYSDQQRPSQ